ncbi:MAG TPA: NrfD/PsrC family molybdoenzyme membrane anchor subunit [Baekduia sp.]|uniref:NrfD/PsrC family molybdoenzyme membrane anchor subunit n=1 Tax=Baekduia sp. TaxID=2600305 RepID=UPI002C5C1D05|nr:NrfD/PsrC family molybdoenzyme membrane anchor subunit [Baekduia sp.]HMJ37011.1 NrfD/PsrC family molybdoenzyme membrane anchor subunit [Baekduia sp.]
MTAREGDARRMEESRAQERERSAVAHSEHRDMTPAVGTPGGPASWKRAVAGAAVGLHQRGWRDARWSNIFRRDSGYASPEMPDPERIAGANRRARRGEPPAVVQGPMMKPPVWTWEVPLYFWFGGMAAGASFVGFACDLAGDHRSARVARMVALGALAPSPPLLIMDLGRPERFSNMLRIFKPRSPMSMGSWCLTVFGGLSSAAVAADLLGRDKVARRLGCGTAVVGGYLGSYTGVLLASTAVPVWARSRLSLGPIFVATATLTGAAATRLVLVADGTPVGHPTPVALGRVESGAMAAELLLSEINHHHLGRLASVLEEGAGAGWFKRAKWLARGGLALRFARRRTGPWTEHAASVCFMAAALCFRFAWVRSGRSSAQDDEAVARMARARATRYEPDLEMPVVQHR